jgi:hypothetical protein
LFAASVARTWKVCVPGSRPVYSLGDVHDAKEPSSSEHWYVSAVTAVPSSFPVKVNVAVVFVVVATGWPVIVV